MGKHTKGPWYWANSYVLQPVNPDASRNIASIVNANGCLVYRDAADGWDDEQAANLALIAAAPELLEALEEIMSGEGVPDLPSWQLDKASAAIAKAKGEK